LLKGKRMEYNPQGLKKVGLKKVKECSHRGNTMGGDGNKSSRPKQVGREYMAYTNFPSDVLEYGNIIGKNAIHPTQKPVALMEYLVKTYTNENETVLDFTMGSGSTGVACVNTNRNFIGIEMDDKYFEIAEKRIKDTKYKLF
jgi:site-specific DNA-methyltransferase (adenine-specific)